MNPRGGRGSDGNGGPKGPEALGPVLKRLLRDLKVEERRRGAGVAAAWDRAAGESLGALARPVSLRGGVLTVEVEGAVLLQELRGFRSRELLEALRREEGGTGVRTIRWVPAGRP